MARFITRGEISLFKNMLLSPGYSSLPETTRPETVRIALGTNFACTLDELRNADGAGTWMELKGEVAFIAPWMIDAPSGILIPDLIDRFDAVAHEWRSAARPYFEACALGVVASNGVQGLREGGADGRLGVES